jgi:hypothetical protein
MLLPYKRKKESLMKFPTFMEVKLNGYIRGGDIILFGKIKPEARNRTKSGHVC